MKLWNVKKDLFPFISICALLLGGCTNGQTAASTGQEAQSRADAEDIVILFTNDVHCGVDDHIGYARLAAYKNQMLEQTPYVALVDCGDAVQGAALGVVSDGESIIEIMNEAGYDYAVLGNHEFDYGLERLSELMDLASFPYLGCNISYTGSGKNELDALVPYEIKEFGDTAVAFVGVSTPLTITSSTPKYFTDANGNRVYDFCEASGDALYARVQESVDACREKGADHVILLTHLGDTETYSPFSSTELIQHTNGVDAVLDGHAHNKIPEGRILNKDGEEVILASTGTKLETIGQLVISGQDLFVSTNINPYSGTDDKMLQVVEKIQADAGKELDKVVAASNRALSCSDENGLRIVRSQETTIGNFCADAFRWISDADIGIVNGGGIRADLPEGDITYADILNVFPYGNTLCKVEATGQEIVDALEFASRLTVKEYAQDGASVGQNGGFYQVSGLRYTIDTEIPASVTTDENDVFVSVDGPYRVKNVEVMDAGGNYVPIDLDKTYTIGSFNYIMLDGGDGCEIFADNTCLIEGGMVDCQVLIDYIQKELKGDLSAYDHTEGRITIE